MALYADGKGRYGTEYGQYWNDLVPQSGQCETKQGEMIRVIGRLASEYYRNGNMNWERGYDRMLEWLFLSLDDASVFTTEQLEETSIDVETIRANAESGRCPYSDDEDEYDRLTDRVVEWCQANPEPSPLEDNLPYNH